MVATQFDRASPIEPAPHRQDHPDGAAILRQMASLRDANIIRVAIEVEYGFTPSLAYCLDFVRFIEDLTLEPRK